MGDIGVSLTITCSLPLRVNSILVGLYHAVKKQNVIKVVSLSKMVIKSWRYNLV